MPTTIQDDPTLQPAPPLETQPSSVSTSLLVCLPPLPPETLTSALETIAAAFPGQSILVASPDQPAQTPESLTLIPYPADRTGRDWVLTASVYAAVTKLAAGRDLTTLLFADTPTSPTLLHDLATTVTSQSIDLALPRFHLGPNDGLVNSAILYPLSRALFGADIHFPLPAAAALSPRMAHRLAPIADRLLTLNQGESLLWPIAEAAIAGFSVREVDARTAAPPARPQEDFNALFTNVATSLFSDVEAKASFWQRARVLPARAAAQSPSLSLEAATVSPEIVSLIESFQLAEANLQDIWSLVLPPQSRLALKRISQLSPAAFNLEPTLWARIVYDFALAFHLRTLNRNHLLGAMIPLYLAWVASHLRDLEDDPTAAAHPSEQAALAFESEKSYFVSRWRWPDRFNP
jgi:hypothetical protein